MKRSLLYTILLLLSYSYAYSQEVTPAVEWAEPYSGGSRGTTIVNFSNTGDLLALVKDQYVMSGSGTIKKFNTDGLVKNQGIYQWAGSYDTSNMSAYASQDGGALVSFVTPTATLRKYDNNLNLSWEKSVSYNVQNAVSTQSGGFYLLTTRTVSSTTVLEIRSIKSDGTEEWAVDVTAFSTTTGDIETSSDDGVIVTTTTGFRKYSSAGVLAWSNTGTPGSYKIIPSDNSAFYVLANITNISYVMQINTSNGNANWTTSLTSETISDFEKTSDKGCVFSTNTGLYKYNSSGVLQWKNLDYTSSKIALTSNDRIFVIKDNAIHKLTYTNVLVWQKSFNLTNYRIEDINGSSDFGLYMNVAKNGPYLNNAPNYIFFKLAPPSNPCKTTFDITGASTTVCRTGSIEMTANFGQISMEHMAYLTGFTFQWYRNNAAIPSATGYSYTATQSGNYHLGVKQQNCETTSRIVELNIVNEIPPVIEAEKNEICFGTSVSLHAKGCDGGTLVWSTGAKGTSVLVSPTTNTTYTAICEKPLNSTTCQSAASNTITITVLPSSNVRISEITGKKEICEKGSTELEPVVLGGIAPFSYLWVQGSTNISTTSKLKIEKEGKYLVHIFDKIGCYFRSDSITVKKVANPAVPVITQPAQAIICTGGTLALTTTTKENSYQWYLNNKEIVGAVNQSYTATAAGSYQLKVINEYKCATMTETALVINTSTLKITQINGTREFCERSSTDLEPVVTGGIAPFSYIWKLNSTNVSNSAKVSASEGGAYTLQVYDNMGCSFQSDPVNITKKASPAIPSITQPASPIICNGKSVVLTTNAKENNYQWLLNNTEIAGAVSQTYSAATAGNYLLKVTNALNCSSTSANPVVVSLSTLKITEITGNKEICEGTSTQLGANISGGIAPLSIQWTKNSGPFSTSAVILVNDEGIYEVSVTDKAGCVVKSDALTMKKTPLPTAPVITSSAGDLLCVGGSTLLSTTTSEAAYQWSQNNIPINGFSNPFYTASIGGEYRLKVTNAKGCTSLSSNVITITQLVLPQPTIKQSNDSLISSASSGNKWYFNTVEMSQIGSKIPFNQLGSYQVKVFDRGCESPISAIFQPVLLANEEIVSSIQLYPNPTTDKVYLKSARLFTYKLMDVSGRLVGKSIVKQDTHTIDFSGFLSGNYFIVMEEENGNRLVKRVNVSR